MVGYNDKILINTLIILLVCSVSCQIENPLYVPDCQKGQKYIPTFYNSSTTINQTSFPQTQLYLCHDDQYFVLNFNVQDFYIRNNFTECNQPLYQQDVVEFFLSNPNAQNPLQNYIEFEISPQGVLFAKHVYNPDGYNFNLSYIPINCSTSGIEVQTQVQVNRNRWLVQAHIPFALVLGENYTQPQFLGNFFRIEMFEGYQCNSTIQNCIYSSYNPTEASPPDFHIPAYFVQIIMN